MIYLQMPLAAIDAPDSENVVRSMPAAIACFEMVTGAKRALADVWSLGCLKS